MADFLIEKEKGGLALSTLGGYRTAIANTLRHSLGCDLGSNPELISIMKSFKQKHLRTRCLVPSWDLALVLEKLRSSPFEPIESCSMKYLTFKAVFLTALASGRRRSELHAIERARLSWPENKEHITCRVSTGFVGKNQIANDSRVVLPFKIKSLKPFLSYGMEQDLSLCPARALFTYMHRTKELNLSRDKKLLFVSYKKGHKGDISRVTLSGWIKKTIIIYFAKSSIFAKYIGHHGFRVSVSACMFFPFVRLQRLYRPHGLSDRPDSFGSRYIQFMGPCSIFTFLYRVKFKVKVTTFVKIKINT